MGPKVKKAPLTVMTDIQSAVNQCLADFFSQTIVNCGCEVAFSALLEEINSCKTLITTQNTIIYQLQKDVSALKLENFKLKANTAKTPNETNHTVDNRRSSYFVQQSNGKTTDKNSTVALNDNFLLYQPADYHNINIHRGSDHRRLSKSHNTTDTTTTKISTLHDEDETSSDEHDHEIFTSLVTADIHLPPKDETRNTKQENVPTTKVADEGTVSFTEVQHKKKKRTRNLLAGAGQGTISGSLRAIEKKFNYFVTGLHPDTTVDDIKEHLHEIVNVEIEKLNLKRSERTASFKLKIPSFEKDKILQDTLWPKGVVINRFYFPKKDNSVQHFLDKRTATNTILEEN